MNIGTEIKTVFDHQNDNGGRFWSRTDGNIHAPNGSSTIDTLSVLGEMDLSINDHPLIADAVNFVFTYQAPEGSFKFSPSSSKLPCITARIVAAFGRFGIASDLRVERGYRWLLNNQWNDGGWRCNMVKTGKSPLTDMSNPGTTLYVLDAFRFRDNQTGEIEKLNMGVDFLLQHWEIRQPLGPCLFGIGSRFLQIEYPFLRYNIFYYVYVLSFYNKARKDKRFQEAYSVLADKIINGKMIIERPHRAWQKFDFAKRGRISDIATNRWMEIETNIKTIKI